MGWVGGVAGWQGQGQTLVELWQQHHACSASRGGFTPHEATAGPRPHHTRPHHTRPHNTRPHHTRPHHTRPHHTRPPGREGGKPYKLNRP
eukprot:353674-Chlamydomonas_euryale.AAC.7